MRLIKCDMCGCIENRDSETSIQVSMSYISNGYLFDTYEICEACSEDLKKILTAGVNSHAWHEPTDPDEDEEE